MTWDKYFYDLCNTIASNSKCFSRKIGAILVRDKSIVASGYNGPPRGVAPCDRRYNNYHAFYRDEKLIQAILSRDVFTEERLREINDVCPRRLLGCSSGQGLEWCIAGHGERNALINAAREGVITKGATMYMNCGIPCSPCLIEIINAGIIEIVCTSYEQYDNEAAYLLKQSNLKHRTYRF